MSDSDSNIRIKPLFFKNDEVEQNEGNYLNTCEICEAVADVVGNDAYVDAAQRIGGLWRVYFLNEEARATALVAGVSLRGVHVTLKDKNPYLITKFGFLGPEEIEKLETTRLYVRNIPLSYDNAAITSALNNMGVKMLGDLKYVRARNKQGKLTNFKTGDRFVDIIVPDEPLPKKKRMGDFTASLYHKEQKLPRTEIECGNCKEKGHLRRECQNEPVCYECMQSGHKRGSPLCPSFAGDLGGVNNKSDDDDDDETDNENAEGEEVDASAGTKEVPKPTGVETRQIPLTKWVTPSHSAPSSPISSRAGSPARIRKAGDITPDESEVKDGKKVKKVKAKNK